MRQKEYRVSTRVVPSAQGSVEVQFGSFEDRIRIEAGKGRMEQLVH